MKELRNILVIILVGVLISFLAQIALAQKEKEMSTGESKVTDGIKATFKVTPSMSMVDILLMDTTTKKTITKAKVFASAKMPDGKVQEKELVGMKMGKEYTFGNTFDFSRKGNYDFDIRVEVKNEEVKFNFIYKVK